jgi:hypothetical protein
MLPRITDDPVEAVGCRGFSSFSGLVLDELESVDGMVVPGNRSLMFDDEDEPGVELLVGIRSRGVGVSVDPPAFASNLSSV